MARPRSMPIRTSSPTPSMSSVSNGLIAEDAHLQVGGEERGLDVVAGEAPGGLGQVVGAEGEELGGLGDLAGGQRRPRQLDHRADQRREVHAALLGDLGQHLLAVGRG